MLCRSIKGPNARGARSSSASRALRGLWGVLSIAALVGAAASLDGCSDETSPTDPDAGSTGDSGSTNDAPGPEIVISHPDAAPLPGETECTVVITTGIEVGSAAHVPACTPLTYATEPPSGGDHWGLWAAYKSYTTPVPREIYTHNLEHGAVVFSYRCAGACPEVTAALAGVIAELPEDPSCIVIGGTRRTVLTPDPELSAPVAVSAWGATYTATCLDPASLESFARSAYAHGPEDICAKGRDLEDPDAGAPDCDAGTN